MRALLLVFLLTQLLASAVPLWDPWPQGDYCIIMGKDGYCPRGFVADFIALAVPMEITPDDKEASGEPFIRTGKAGGIDLSARIYDNIYRLKISACCRSGQM
ncbi:hypothetical protein QR680_000657 [Steinernema hermaphroditum]|uniref:Uncharacterized protein n=1 Tax=Steinernema hermaphroditum TaxID=289476 RepID=A0AA39GVC6_9BILA|nr:hypothetical protein QR680_000657 [Steinernema hermaphroditum]